MSETTLDEKKTRMVRAIHEVTVATLAVLQADPETRDSVNKALVIGNITLMCSGAVDLIAQVEE